MKRSEAETAVISSILASPYDYKDLIEAMVTETVSSWEDDQLADFLWGDDDSQTIEPN